jgi:3-deoxy-D-manno-octulosonate 8-phosphate phosphatase (KDO 8-P phosphatase)
MNSSSAPIASLPALSAGDRARRIKIILFDVDGVMTDGGIWIFPAPAAASEGTRTHLSTHDGKAGYGIQSADMIEAKGFHAHDGTGISLARLGGMKCGFITKRVSDTVALRARDLKLEYLYMGQSFKIQAVQEIMAKEGATIDEIAFVGDDIIDLPVMRVCGLAIAVANARPQVKAAAHYITAHEGGHGAGRDAVEFILEAQGSLSRVIEEYIDERGGAVDRGDGYR